MHGEDETGDFTRAETNVVLAAAGSSDPAANASIAALAARMEAADGWRRVVPAYASAAGPRPDEAVRALRARGRPVLGDAPEVSDVILDRYQAAASAELAVARAARA